jgi:hypothetical protein
MRSSLAAIAYPDPGPGGKMPARYGRRDARHYSAIHIRYGLRDHTP